MEKNPTIQVKDSDGTERTYTRTTRGVTVESLDVAVKAVLDQSGEVELFISGQGLLQRHTVSVLGQPESRSNKINWQIRALRTGAKAENSAGQPEAGLLNIHYEETDPEFNRSAGWHLVLYVPKDAVTSLIGQIHDGHLGKLSFHGSPDWYTADGALSFAPLNMPQDFFVKDGMAAGTLAWLSAEALSINTGQEQPLQTATEDNSKSHGYQRQVEELVRYAKWSAYALVALVVAVLSK